MSERLRQIGRLLIQIRKQDRSITCLTDCISPDKFSVVCEAIHTLCGFDSLTHIYRTPSLALKLGHTLKACTKTAISSAMQTHRDDRVKTFANFIRLCDLEWSEKISSHALRSLSRCKFNKPSILPLAEDVNKLQMFLKTAASQFQDSLMEDNRHAWTELCKVTLTQVILLNRRRGGEAERMLVSAHVMLQIEATAKLHD